MATDRQITVASTWAFDNEGVNDIQTRFKANQTNGGETFCKYDPNDDVFLLDVGVGAEPLPGFTRLMNTFIDDEKNNDLMEKARVERIAVVVDPAEMAALDDEEEQKGALVDVGFEPDQFEAGAASAPPGFCEQSWVSESGGAGCFAKVSPDILRSLEQLTGTDISLEEDKIRITGSRVYNVDAAMERLTCLEKPFSLVTSPPVENMVQEYNENDYRLQFQKYDNLPNYSIQQILIDYDATRIRERLFNANICLLLIFDSDIQRFIPMRNSPAPVDTGHLQKGRSKSWSGFQFREMGQPENNLEPLTTAAPEQQPSVGEANADPPIEPPEVIDDHPYMSQEKATLVNDWVKGAAEVATDPDDLLALGPGAVAQKEKEKPVEVKKPGGVKTRRAVASAVPIAPANVGPKAEAQTVPDAETAGPANATGNNSVRTSVNASVNAPANTAANTAPTTSPDAPPKAPSNTAQNALSDTLTNVTSKEAPSTPVKDPPAEVTPSTVKKQGRLPSLNIPESKFNNLASPEIDVDKEAKEEPEPSPCTVVQAQESVPIDPSIPRNKNGLPRLKIAESKLLDLTPEKAEDGKDKVQKLVQPAPALKLQETVLVDPFTAPRLVYKEQSAADNSLPTQQWPETFNCNAYGPPKGAGRGNGRGDVRGNGRGGGRGSGRGAPKTPQKPRPAEATTPRGNPRGRTPGRSERVTYHRPSGPPRLIDASFASVEVAKAGVEPLSFSQPALIPDNSKIVASASDSMSSSSPPPQTEPRGESKESILDAPVLEDVDTELYENEKRLRDLKLSYEQEQGQENTGNFVQSESGSISAHSRCGSQASSKTIYQKRLEELKKLRVKEKMQVVSEVESRDFHRTMGQKAPAPQQGQQRGKTKADLKKEKRQAVLEEAWGFAPRKATAPKDEKTLENEKTIKGQKEKAKKEAVDPLLTKLYPLLKPILSSARYYPGTLKLEIQFGLTIIPTLPGSYNGNMFQMKDWKTFFYPSNGLVAPSTMFIDRLTTAGSDVDYILGLKDGKGEKAIQFFEEKPSKRDVIYEFHCKTKTTGIVVITISDTGDTVVTRPETGLGSVNMHFPSQTWDARVVLSSKLEYVSGINPELDRAIQVLVDKLYVVPNKSRVTMYTRTSDINELEVVKVLVKRTTRHRYVFSAKKDDDGNSAAQNTDTDTPGPAAEDGTAKPCQVPNEADDPSSEELGIFLQITEVQNLFFTSTTNDRNAYHCRSRVPETMVNSHRLWYEVSIVSSAIEDMLLENKEISPGESATTWRESDILGKDAHIDTSQQNPDPQAKEETEEVSHNQANTIGTACLGEMLRIATRVISRLDGVGYWNEGPLQMMNFENPIGLMLTTAGENVLPGNPAAVGATSGAVGGGVAGGAAEGPAGGGAPASEAGAKDMESASVRAGNPAFGGGVDEFW